MVIRRKLALLGLFFLLCQLAAAQMPPGTWFALTAVCAAAIFVFCRFFAKQYTLLFLLLSAVALVGFQQLYVHLILYPTAAQHQGANLPLLVRVEKTGECYEDDRVSAQVTVLESDGKSCHYTAYCSVFPNSEPGELVRGLFDVSTLADDEYKLSRLADGIYLELTYLSDADWIGEQQTFWLAVQQWRLMLSRKIRQYISFDAGSLLCAMTLGERTGLSEEWEILFRQAGVSHLLVVSGLHLSLVCGILAGSLKNSRVRAVANLVIFPAYAVLTGFSPSIFRAGTALAIGSIGALFALPVDSFTSLGMAALLLGIANPFASCDLGLQLSFAATLGVLCAGALYSRVTRNQYPVPRRFQLVNILLVPVFAAWFSLPVQLAQNMELSGVSVLSNLLCLYLIQPILVLGLLCAVCALTPMLAVPLQLLSRLAEILIRLLVAILRATASLPFSRIVLEKDYYLCAWMILMGLALLFWFSPHHWKRMLIILPFCTAFAVGISTFASFGLVHVALVGSSSSPCMIAWQGDDAILVFQGGYSAVKEVREYLEVRCLDLRYILDIRQKADNNFWEEAACPAIQVQQLPVGMQTNHQVSDILVESYHAKNGCLARLSVGGYSMVLCSGTVRLANPLAASVWILGNSGESSDIQADLQISPGRLAGGEVLYGDGDILEIRPGKSVRMIEVYHVDE